MGFNVSEVSYVEMGSPSFIQSFIANGIFMDLDFQQIFVGDNGCSFYNGYSLHYRQITDTLYRVIMACTLGL